MRYICIMYAHLFKDSADQLLLFFLFFLLLNQSFDKVQSILVAVYNYKKIKI